MKVSNRQRRILEVLLSRQEEVTAGRLAAEAGVSARTVHRELHELEPVLEQHGLFLVKKSGVGISLQGSPSLLARFQEELRRSETEAYSPDERKVLLLCRLLEQEEPAKLFTLAREVQAAIPTVSRDLDELHPELERHGLELVRRRGYGVEIAGPETAKRRFIVWMAEEYLDHSDWFGAPADNSLQSPVTRRLLDLVGKDTFLQIEQALWQQAEEWGAKVGESEYTKLLIRLSVVITRIKRKHGLDTAASDKDDNIGARQTIGSNIKLSRFAETLGLELPAKEADFLQAMFDEARESAADASTVILEKYGLQLADRTVTFIRCVQNRMEIELSRDRSLLDGLIRHLGPALDRIRRGETIRNPLLQQIRKDYSELFDTVRRCAGRVWPELSLPDEEIGYLTMHFGAAEERWKLSPGNVKAILVCTSGIGSSKLLAVRISKEIPQIDLIGNYSWYEASRVPDDQYDLIISTIDLPVEPDRYVKLSPLLTREETEKLRSHIREMTAHAGPAAGEDPAKDNGAWNRLKRISAYAPIVTSLLETFHVYELNNEPPENGNMERMLSRMLDMVPSKWDSEDKDSIVKQLIERERQGSLLIPDSELALYHTRSDSVREPVLALFRLRFPHRMVYEADGASFARQILLMLAPKELSKQALEVLSEISGMLLSPELIRLLEEQDEDRIRVFLSHHLEIYIENK
ncbi:BglG family transcription antiterminator [Cohnella pontilimi]|nr:BglG family transcription antiterminator [Cohnella pontilimi]